MTLQQMEYIVALDKYRHFVLAAEACNVTQPTLSAMLQKLEDELGVKIFERNNKNIEPTTIGTRIIQQARIALNETYRIKELIADEMHTLSGTLKMGITPTIAPYLVPDFIYHFQHDYPDVDLQIQEMRNEVLYNELDSGNLDLGIATTPPAERKLLEIPLYKEQFVAYFSTQCRETGSIHLNELDTTHMWILHESHCMQNQNYPFCLEQRKSNTVYKAGSIETLLRIVDRNGGFTIIPKMHLPFLSAQQQTRVYPLEGNGPLTRTVSILIKPDYLREKMLNAVANTVRAILPDDMIDDRLKKFNIRL